MLEGLIAAGFYSCFYGSGRGAVRTGIGAAGLSLVSLRFPEFRFAALLLMAFWIMACGFLWAELPGCKGEAQRREQLFLSGGVWLMACSLAELGVGNVLLPVKPLQAALVLAMLVRGALYLLGRGKPHPLWLAVLAVMCLLTGFLGGIVYAQPWQSQVMTVLLYLTAGGVLVFWQMYCIRRELEQSAWKDRPEAEGDTAAKGSWREEASREYRQLQIFEHDFRHHMDIVAALYEEGSAAEARAYMEDLKQARESRRGLREGSERELSCIMMAKRKACRQAEISFSYQIVGSPRGIAQMDMTALLLNLLDNAVRACKEAPKPRSIGVMLLSRGELWEIEMINSGQYKPEEARHEKPGKGTGSDAEAEWGAERKAHGIGLVSVRQIVEKYQGIYRIWQEEGQVRQKLILVQRVGQEELQEAESVK